MIQPLSKYHLPGQCEALECAGADQDCPGFDVDGECAGSQDSTCIGIGSVDGDCPMSGDSACGGIATSDSCSPLTGLDSTGCFGIKQIDINIAAV